LTRALLVLVMLTSTASAGPDDFVQRLLVETRARIDAAIAARPPVLVPPKKIAVKWRLTKVASIDLGAPLLALTGGSLIRGGRGELYAVTPREVIALGLHGKKLVELGRAALSGERAIPTPRDLVASAIVNGETLVVHVSSFATSTTLTWVDKALVATPGTAGFDLCPGVTLQLTPGRNYFGDLYNARCASLVDAEGRALRVRGDVSVANKLTVTSGAQTFEYKDAGVAIELADVDHDGTPEVIYSAAAAPGDADTLRVLSLGDDEKKPKLKKGFTAGGIAGIAAVDGQVFLAVRLVGATRVDFWRVE
jgi:hypothetical protein